MEELRRLRKAKGLSQAKLAVLADLDPSTVSQIETGARRANTRTLERLAAVLGADVADLFPKVQNALPLEDGPTALEARVSRVDSIPELRRMAKALKAQWRELAAYERVSAASPSESARDMQRLAEIEQGLSIIKKRLDELDPPLCWITYRLDKPHEVQFNPNRTPTEEETAELRKMLGDYEVVEDFALAV
jgi:transcriptional regulator with XRE-family HTH domain